MFQLLVGYKLLSLSMIKKTGTIFGWLQQTYQFRSRHQASVVIKSNYAISITIHHQRSIARNNETGAM